MCLVDEVVACWLVDGGCGSVGLVDEGCGVVARLMRLWSGCLVDEVWSVPS